MKKFIILIITAVLAFSTTSAIIQPQLDESEFEKRKEQALRGFAIRQANQMSKCKAYSDHLIILVDHFVKENNQEPGVGRFVVDSVSYSKQIDKKLKKYYQLSIENLSPTDVEKLNTLYVNSYEAEHTILKKGQENPSEAYAKAYKSLLDKCVNNNII